MTFIYHRVPSQFLGNTLYPLNRLKGLYPDLYEKAAKKYKGREWLVDSRVAPFNCVWNDVLFFSPVPPWEIRRGFNEAEIKHEPIRYFIIPAQRLDPARATIMHYRYSRTEERRYERFDPNDLNRFKTLSPAAVVDHRRRHAESGIIMIFAHVPHILYLGELEVGDLSIVEG